MRWLIRAAKSWPDIREQATKLQLRPKLQPKTSKANLRHLLSEDRYMYHVILT